MESGRQGQDEEVFGKASGSQGNDSINASLKVDERTSLLPDGTRVPNPGAKSDEAAIKIEGENGGGANGSEGGEEEGEDGPLTKG